MPSLAQLAKEVHQTARAKGWWDTSRSDAELIALEHSELSEALEAFRSGNPPSDATGLPLAVEELADCIIRILDHCEARGFDIEEAILAKMAYNKTRPHRHGKLF